MKTPFTKHDMRRGFNKAAELAGMSIKERSAVLGHSPEVNHGHYGGETVIDFDSLAKKINNFSELDL